MTHNSPDVWLGRTLQVEVPPPKPAPARRPAIKAGGDMPTPPTSADLDAIQARREERVRMEKLADEANFRAAIANADKLMGLD